MRRLRRFIRNYIIPTSLKDFGLTAGFGLLVVVAVSTVLALVWGIIEGVRRLLANLDMRVAGIVAAFAVGGILLVYIIGVITDLTITIIDNRNEARKIRAHEDLPTE